MMLEAQDEDALQTPDKHYHTYPTPVLPASYFIDNLGKPIEVITLLKDPRLRRVLFENHCFGQNSRTAKESANIRCSVPASSSSPPPSAAALEEKVKRAKILLEQKKKADEEAKIEEEKRRELERINAGKLMQEAQQKRHEQELIEAAAQRRRDKIEAEKERERLKAQIKADREEREFRERRGRPVDASAGDMPKQPEPPKMEPVPSDRCRVQVRLPDGDNIVEEFASSDCLSVLVDLIRQDGRVSGAFSIAQVYPRKVFTGDEMQKSFLDLCLTPNCTLLVIQSRPKSSQIISANPLRGILSLLSMLVLAPLQYFYNTVSGWLGWNSGMESFKNFQRGNTSRLHNTNDDSDEDNANWNEICTRSRRNRKDCSIMIINGGLSNCVPPPFLFHAIFLVLDYDKKIQRFVSRCLPVMIATMFV
ncbi:UBX domain protein [Cooperia oncophora]